MADQIAEAGYISLAPDLLSGEGPNGGGTASFENSDAARTAIYDLNPEQVTADLNATVDFVKKIPSGSGKVAVIGFDIDAVEKAVLLSNGMLSCFTPQVSTHTIL